MLSGKYIKKTFQKLAKHAKTIIRGTALSAAILTYSTFAHAQTPTKYQGYCAPVAYDAFVKKVKDEYDSYATKKINKHKGITPTPINEVIGKKTSFCNDLRFMYDLRKTYSALDNDFDLEQKISVEFMDSNKKELNNLLQNTSAEIIRKRSKELKRFLSQNPDVFSAVKKNPAHLISLSLNSDLSVYTRLFDILLRKNISAKKRVADIYECLKAKTDNLHDLNLFTINLQILKEAGFHGVHTQEIPALSTAESISTILNIDNAVDLYENLNIINFGWFSKELLEKVSQTYQTYKTSGKKNVIYLVTRNAGSSHFFELPELHDKDVLRELKEYSPILIQPNDVYDLEKILKKFEHKNISADIFMVSSHGKQKYISLTPENKITTENLNVFADDLDKVLTDNAIIILNACNTAKHEDNLSKDLAKITHRAVYGAISRMDFDKFWFVSSDEVILGKHHWEKYGYTLHKDKKRIVPPRPGMTISGEPKIYKKVIDLTKKYYFPKKSEKDIK